MPGSRKHAQRAFTGHLDWPKEGCHIVKAQGSRGDNLIAVDFINGSSSLVLLPAKFRKTVWIKKDNFLIVEQREQPDSTSKSRISGSIEAILSPDDIHDLKRRGVWPVEFMQPARKAHTAHERESNPGPLLMAIENTDTGSDEGLPPLQPNTNRPTHIYSESDEDDRSYVPFMNVRRQSTVYWKLQ